MGQAEIKQETSHKRPDARPDRFHCDLTHRHHVVLLLRLLMLLLLLLLLKMLLLLLLLAALLLLKLSLLLLRRWLPRVRPSRPAAHCRLLRHSRRSRSRLGDGHRGRCGRCCSSSGRNSARTSSSGSSTGSRSCGCLASVYRGVG